MQTCHQPTQGEHDFYINKNTKHTLHYVVRVWVRVPHAAPVEAAVAAARAVRVAHAVVEHQPHDRVLRGEALGVDIVDTVDNI